MHFPDFASLTIEEINALPPAAQEAYWHWLGEALTAPPATPSRDLDREAAIRDQEDY